MADFLDTPASTKLERAFLVGVQTRERAPGEGAELLDELTELVENLRLTVTRRVLVNLRQPTPALLLGSGKAEELAEQAKADGADVIVFDEALSPAQQRNWEKLSGLAVIDRQEVILEVFADRAHTREAVLQVALAAGARRFVPAGWLRVGGEDVVGFLQGQCSQDVAGLPVGRCAYALWLSQKGRVEADSLVFRLGPREYALLSEGTAGSFLRERFERFIIADDVTVRDDSDGTEAFWLVGPAEALAESGLGGPLAIGEVRSVSGGLIARDPRRDGWRGSSATTITTRSRSRPPAKPGSTVPRRSG